MSLTSKLRPLAMGAMLSAATLGIFSGCATQWQSVRTDLVPTGTQRTVTRDAGEQTIKQKTFDISDVYLENEGYKTRITESLTDLVYHIEGKKKAETFNKVTLEKREIGGEAAMGITILTTIGGAVGGAAFTKSALESRGQHYVAIDILGGVGGGLIGLLGGAGLGNLVIKTEKRQTNTGKVEQFSAEDLTATFLRQNIISQNVPPSKKINFGVVGKEQLYETDYNGLINWRNTNPLLFTSREGLEKRLDELPLVQDINPETRERLREKLVQAILPYREDFIIETREKPASDSELVKNCTKALKFDYYVLRDDAIYAIAKQFVNEEINPSIKTLNFFVRDKLTHVQINGTNFEFTTDAPSKSELAGKYFSGKLKDYAERVILDYLYGSAVIPNCLSKQGFSVYYPSSMFVEITHPQYNYVSGEVDVGEYLTKSVPVEMVDLGTKVRVENSEESLGKIGE